MLDLVCAGYLAVVDEVRPGQRAAADPGRSVLSWVLSGVGLIALLDETVVPQRLHRHHVYDPSKVQLGLVSDDPVRTFGYFAVVAGLWRLAELGRRESLRVAPALLIIAGSTLHLRSRARRRG